MSSFVINKSTVSSVLEVGKVSKLRYWLHDVWDEHSDPRVVHFPLIYGGPWIGLVIVGLYLMFVKVWGPNWMKNRKPFDLRQLMLVYNLIMAAFSTWLFVEGMYLLNFGLDTWGCRPVDPGLKNPELTTPKNWRLINLAYFFYLAKFIELLDTVFFILRKKFNQVSRLHVIHHAVMPILCWACAKYLSKFANETVAFFPLVNTGVHSIMYTYYGLSTLGPWIQPYLWWKKYLTQLQLSQFLGILIHTMHFSFIPNCEYPAFFTYLGITASITFLGLFGNFYIKAYIKRKNDANSKKSE